LARDQRQHQQLKPERHLPDILFRNSSGYLAGSAGASPVKLMAVGDAWGEGTFSSIKYSFKMNSAGQVVFWANLSYNDG
jgi:hypothetical protein